MRLCSRTTDRLRREPNSTLAQPVKLLPIHNAQAALRTHPTRAQPVKLLPIHNAQAALRTHPLVHSR